VSVVKLVVAVAAIAAGALLLLVGASALSLVVSIESEAVLEVDE